MMLIFISYFYTEMKSFRILFIRTVIFWVFTQIFYGVIHEKAAGIRIMSKILISLLEKY